MDIERKIKKICVVLKDPSTSEGEKKAAEILLEKLQGKYDVDISEIDAAAFEWFEIQCSNDYEKMLLIRLLASYDLKPYIRKTSSKNLILFSTSTSYYEIIKAEFEYHKNVLSKYLKSVTVNYLHKFVFPYPLPENRERKTDELTDEAAIAASLMFLGKNYSVRKMLL